MVVGGSTVAVMTALHQLIPGRRLLRCCMGAAFMVMSALNVNQSYGMLDIHYGCFVQLAFLVYYRDWLAIVVAAGVIAGELGLDVGVAQREVVVRAVVQDAQVGQLAGGCKDGRDGADVGRVGGGRGRGGEAQDARDVLGSLDQQRPRS